MPHRAPLADAPPVELPNDPRSREARAVRFDFFELYPYDHPRAGEHITREATCGCGRVYEQELLSALVFSVAEAKSPTARALIHVATPDGYVPVRCPACESRALGAGRTAALADGDPTTTGRGAAPVQERLDL